MQKFRERRNWDSEIQHLRSTSSLCMIAICPAGPPKLMNPSFTQNHNASLNLIASIRPVFCAGLSNFTLLRNQQDERSVTMVTLQVKLWLARIKTLVFETLCALPIEAAFWAYVAVVP